MRLDAENADQLFRGPGGPSRFCSVRHPHSLDWSIHKQEEKKQIAIKIERQKSSKSSINPCWLMVGDNRVSQALNFP